MGLERKVQQEKELRQTAEWFSIIRDQAAVCLYTSLPNGIHTIGEQIIVVSGIEDTQRHYPLFNIDPSVSMTAWTFATVEPMLRVRRSYALVSEEDLNDVKRLYVSYDFNHEEKLALPLCEGKMLFSYLSLCPAGQVTSDINRGSWHNLDILIPNHVGKQLIHDIGIKPDIIEEIFQACCPGLTTIVKRYKGNILEVVIKNKVADLLGKIGLRQKSQLLYFSKPVGEIKQD